MGALIVPLLLAAALLAPAAALAQPSRGGAEAQIKAAFLYKFGGFVEWPPAAFARADGAFAVGVLGADAVASALEQITAGRTVQDRPVSMRRLRRGDSYAGLHVLFVGREEVARLPEILAAVKGQPLLMVTDSEHALAQGSMINFIADDNKVRFDVALPAVERGQLRISSRLLAVARKVIQGAS